MTGLRYYIGTKQVQAEPADKNGVPGYFVFYEDGYASWSPKEPFDKAYRLVDGLNFGLALEAMLKGMKVRSAGWPAGKHLEYVPEEEYKFPYIREVVKTEEGEDHRMWLCPQIDVLANDWMVI